MDGCDVEKYVWWFYREKKNIRRQFFVIKCKGPFRVFTIYYVIWYMRGP